MVANDGTIDSADATGVVASLSCPAGISIDSTGNHYMADTYSRWHV